MISVDGSFIVQVVNFIALIIILNMVLYKPIRKGLIQRKEKTDGLEKQIDMFNKDALEKENEFASGMKDARSKGFKEKQHLIEIAVEEEKLIIEKINQKAQAELDAIRKKIEDASEGVRVVLNSELDTFADIIGEKILGRAA